MVKTFLCHPYTEPKSFIDQYDAVTFCCTSDDRILIAAASESVHIHNLKHKGCPKISKFSTVAVPVKMLHTDKFLLSMECPLSEFKKYAQPHELNCQVRVYINFNKVNLPKPVRVANGYTHNSSVSYVNYIDKFMAIDISIRHQIVDVSLCHLKNNIAVASKKKIYVYGYKELRSEDENYQHCFVDFFRLIEIAPSFMIRKISLFGCWLSFSSRREIQVIQMFVREPDDEQICQAEDVSEALSELSSIDEHLKLVKTPILNNDDYDESFVIWDFNAMESGATVDEDGANELLFDAMKKEPIYVDSISNPIEIEGPTSQLPGHPIRCVFNQIYSSGNTVTFVTLLYRQFNPDDLSISGKVNSIHSLSFLPTFVEGGFSQERNVEYVSWPWNIFQIDINPTLLNLCLFFSSGRQGFLYNISTSLEKLVTYNYTSDCFGAVHSRSFLYTYTLYGIEIYTSRLYTAASLKWKEQLRGRIIEKKNYETKPTLHQYHKKNQSSMELFTELNYFGSYVKVSKDDADEASGACSNSFQPMCFNVYSPDVISQPCPTLDVEVCLIGMYALDNMTALSQSTSYITAMVKTGKREKQGSGYTNQWRLYVLEKTQTEDIYSELIHLVEGNEYSNPGVYYQILCEAYLLLRSDSLFGSVDNDMKNLMDKSALMLADFLARNDSFDEISLAEYYEYTETTFKDVIQKFLMADLPKGKKFLFSKNFIHYIKAQIFDHHTEKNPAITQEECSFIVKILFKNEPALLSKALLQSNVLHVEDEMALKFLNKVKSRQEGKHMSASPADMFCLAYINLRLGNPAQCEDLLKQVAYSDLLLECMKHRNLIITEHLLTPFGTLIKKYFQPLFQSILVKLYNENQISVEGFLEFYKKSDSNGYQCYSYKVCELLEILLCDSKQKKQYSKLAEVLVKQYIFWLKSGPTLDSWKTNHVHLPKSSGHFGERFDWLDNIHPFNGGFSNPQDCVFQKSSSRFQKSLLKSSPTTHSYASSFPNKESSNFPSCSPHAASSPYRNNLDVKINKRTYCPCCCCSEVLLKFQSLLSSRSNRKELSMYVIDQLTDVSFVGKDSLLLLCWPKAGMPQEAVELVVDKYPCEALQYAKDMFDWKAQWQLLLLHTLNMLKGDNGDHWNQNYLNCLKGVLSRLSRAYPPEEFMSFLPPDGNIHFFLPYVRECWEYNASVTVKQQFLNQYSKNNK